jgi:diguanylate cyclase (GGDEF)-like protein
VGLTHDSPPEGAPYVGAPSVVLGFQIQMSLTRPSRATLGKLYVAAVIAAGFGVLGLVAVTQGSAVLAGVETPIIVLALAILAGEIFPVKLGRGEGELVLSATFMFALLLFGGIAPALLVQAVASTLADRLHRKRLVAWAFNTGQYALAIAASGLLYELLADRPTDGIFSLTQLVAALVAGAAFFILNTALVSTVVALTQGVGLREQFTGELQGQAVSEAILLGLAPLTVLAVHSSVALVPLLALPLAAIRRAGTHALVSQRLALHDALTGLPNRVLFAQRSGRAIANAERREDRVVVMLIDLDRFKDINDTLGHHYGDEVLRQMARRLTELLDPSDTVARLGGDEFAVLLDAPRATDDGLQVAGQIRAALAQPFEAEGVSLELGGSVGVACYPDDGDDVETLMQRADVAMYQAKAGATGVERYSVQQDDSSLARLALAADLRRALEESEFVPYFQPKIDLLTGRVSGAEALLRWNHPTEKSVSPDVFIPLAEQTGLIVPLTLHVIAAAVRECSAWRTDGGDYSVAVNLSARALVEAQLPDHVEELCRCWNLPFDALVLEITESMIVDDPARAMPVVRRLADLGVRLSIDDFGTGYSSLEYLKTLPVREMKIDRSFVAGMADDPRDGAIVRCAIELGRALGLSIVAEGVESLEAHLRLARLGCDQGQGYHYSRALDSACFAAWLRRTEELSGVLRDGVVPLDAARSLAGVSAVASA